jgi:hypothetical protein
MAGMASEGVVDVESAVAMGELEEVKENIEPGLRNVLVVGEDFVRRGTWGRWLRAAGFHTATCPGPDVSPGCPRTAGDACPLREWARVAVVDLSGREELGLYGGWTDRLCTRLPDDGGTVFVHTPEAGLHDGAARAGLVQPVTNASLEGAVRAALA